MRGLVFLDIEGLDADFDDPAVFLMDLHQIEMPILFDVLLDFGVGMLRVLPKYLGVDMDILILADDFRH